MINLLNKYVKHIKIFLVLLSFSSIIVYFNPVDSYKEFGNLSWIFLIIVMIIRPLRDIFSKCKIFSFLAKFRREMWILVWVFWIAHTIWFALLMEYENWVLGLFSDEYVWKFDWMMFWWMLAFLVSIPLLITSNWFCTRILGKNWKRLQYLAYLMFPFVAIHIALIEKEIWPFIPVIAWIVLLVIATIKNKKSQKKLSSWPKWLCVPCWWIYDENIWDPDSWIAPGTKFEDIPNNWLCHVCWVWKSDFILLKDDIIANESEIVSINYLTNDVIELKIDTKKDLDYTSWQFMNFAFSDSKWDFSRSYSIANKEWNILTFLIKITELGRWWKVLKKLKNWDKLYYNMISWKFTLKDTKVSKVFIATGTGLAPIYSMLLNTPENLNKKLYFWVAKESDLFYLENLAKIKNLEIKIYLSKEEIKWYNFGRVNLENEWFDTNAEFYICGNPWLVNDSRKILEENGFTEIYSEEF